MSKQPYVLIVEDDAWLAQQQVRSLESAGFQADYVPHALAAMDTIDERQPDVMVLDVFLIGPNAFTLLHEMRSHADLAQIPVILCTNSADSVADEDIAGYGITQVLHKADMTPADLVVAVKRVL